MLQIWAACLILGLAASVHAQQADTGSVFNATRVFNLNGTVYSRAGILGPQAFNIYTIPIPSNATSPDILMSLNSTSGGTGLSLYCNPQGGQWANSTSVPGPGYAVWSSELTTVSNQLFISKNDPDYSSANTSSGIAFLCSVINDDLNTTSNYTLTANIVSDNRTLLSSEQTALSQIFALCCQNTGSCNFWKNQNTASSSNANGGAIYTDFCSFEGQVCSPTGNLYRLDLSAYNLNCPWPGTALSSFSQLSSLSLAMNANLTGNTSTVFSSLANATALQFLDLSGDTGITGVIENGTAASSLCKSAMGGLGSLTLSAMNLSGGIPSCLYGQNSTIIALDLSLNRFSGSIADSFPTNSPLQLFHVQNNSLTGKMPSTLANATFLADLNTSCNLMTGTLPAGIGSIKPLQSFVAFYNSHTGAIPDSFGTAPNLAVFDVKANGFTALPSAWTNASYVARNSSFYNIRASMNNISGLFPTGLASAQQLTYLVLNQNKMSGSLPTNTSMFPNLRALNISTNNFSGSIPTQFGQSGIFAAAAIDLGNGVDLGQVFDLSNNHFSGSLPSFLNQSSVPTWTQNGIYLQNNSLTVDCSSSSFSYILSLCPNGNKTTSSTQVPLPAPATEISTSSPPPRSPSPPPPATAVTQTASQKEQEQKKNGHHGLSGGAVAGIVIGVLAAVALGAYLAFLLVKRRKREALMPRDSGTFAMPNFNDGEFGRKNSLKKGLTSLSSSNSGFERFNDEQNVVELSKNGAK